VDRRVSLVRCAEYELGAVEEAVRRAIDLVGGTSRYVQPGQRVLLKPNLLRGTPPEAAVCTHPLVVAAVTRLVQEAGGIPVIGDSPGGPLTGALLRPVYQRTGMARVAEETGAELNWDVGQERVSHLDGHLVKSFEIGTYVRRVDVVISLPKLKTHGLMRLTGAVKNLFGTIPGTTKMAYHAKFPEPEQFGEMLLDLATLVRPALSLMDAVVGMDGPGPSGGDPFPIGVLIAGSDPSAVDLVAAELIGAEVEGVYTLRAATRRGLIPPRAEGLDLAGDPLTDLAVRGFRVPYARRTPGRLVSVLGRLVKRWMVAVPRANARCVACGVCVRNCPVDAIEIRDGRARMDLKTCIRCYCCHEMCPERAIDLDMPLLGRLIP